MKIIKSFGFNIFSDNLDLVELQDGCRLLTTISPNSYGISTKDKVFREALINSDYLVLDGVYFALSSILLNGKNIKRNQGPDVFYHFMQRINMQKGKVFFLGSSDDILNKIRDRAENDYPHISIKTYSPPFKDVFTKEEDTLMINEINSFESDVLFIGMTCPKQEKWAYLHKNRLNVKLICCVGAVFDWYAGNQKEIHPMWWKLRLAWLKRTIDRPEILKRYPNIAIFFRDLFLTIIGFKRFNK